MTITPYLNEFGQPRIRNSITAFLDVLGFSQSVVAAEKSGRSQQCLSDIVMALHDARTFVRRTLHQEKFGDQNLWTTKVFSDNLLLGYPCDNPTDAASALALVIQCTQRYQLQMALNGYFVRGALSLGPLCVTDDIVFGTALIDSYQLESKVSIVPRVILVESLVEMLKQHVSTNQDSLFKPFLDLICHDIDGWWFVNYLQAAVEDGSINWDFIAKHKESVVASLPIAPRHDILPKYGWVSRYHNVFCFWNRNDKGYRDEYRIKRADEESSIKRMSDALTIS